MSIRSTFVSGDISVLQETFDLAYSKYDSLYVSMGGKYNQSAVSFYNPSYLASNQYHSNSSYQMIPEFLRHPSSRVLVVVVDDYNNDEIRQTNVSIVENLCSQHTHIDVVLYHKKLHLDDVPALATTFVQFAQTRNISPAKCMFCNFIRFRGCTSVDIAQFETEVPRIFQKTLDKLANGEYSDCLYQWFGYQYYVYHLVYSYKRYDTKRHLSVLRLLSECCGKTQLTHLNVDILFDFPHSHYPHNKEVLQGIIDTTVDLMSPATDETALCSPLRQFCSDDALFGAHYTFSPDNRALAAAIDL